MEVEEDNEDMSPFMKCFEMKHQTKWLTKLFMTMMTTILKNFRQGLTKERLDLLFCSRLISLTHTHMHTRMHAHTRTFRLRN